MFHVSIIIRNGRKPKNFRWQNYEAFVAFAMSYK